MNGLDGRPNPTMSLFDILAQTIDSLSTGDIEKLQGLERLLTKCDGLRLEQDCSRTRRMMPVLRHLLNMTKSNLRMLDRLSESRSERLSSVTPSDAERPHHAWEHSDLLRGNIWAL